MAKVHRPKFSGKKQLNCLRKVRPVNKGLKSHICINRLWLTHCDLGSSPEILLVILQSEVEYICLNNNNIDSLGAVKIAEYLEGDPPIVRLSLACNRLNDDDAILISQALKRNTNLKTLSLHTNNLTCIGAKALITCVFDGSSLNAISGSNHMLERMDILSDWEVAISFSHSFCSCILASIGPETENCTCLARQGFTTPISCKYTSGIDTRSAGISSWTG